MTLPRPSFAMKASALVLTLGFVACSSAGPRDHFYRLHTEAAGAASSPQKLDGVIEVGRFSAPALLQQRPILYVVSTQPHVVLQHRYHYWTDAPTVMLQQELVAYLRRAGIGTEVVTPEARVKADYVIRGRINRLERVLDGSSADVSLELELGLRRTSDGKVLGSGVYRVERSSDGDEVSETVSALSLAVADAYRQFIQDLQGP